MAQDLRGKTDPSLKLSTISFAYNITSVVLTGKQLFCKSFIYNVIIPTSLYVEEIPPFFIIIKLVFLFDVTSNNLLSVF